MRAAAPAPVVLKVIIESAVLTDEQIVRVCQAAEAAGADYVKTSTGLHPAGGASAHAVELMAKTVCGRLALRRLAAFVRPRSRWRSSLPARPGSVCLEPPISSLASPTEGPLPH